MRFSQFWTLRFALGYQKRTNILDGKQRVRDVPRLLRLRILQKQDFRDVYKEKYKGIAVSLQILINILTGKYAHYEIFDVYGDTVLKDSLKLALQMCLQIPRDGKII